MSRAWMLLAVLDRLKGWWHPAPPPRRSRKRTVRRRHYRYVPTNSGTYKQILKVLSDGEPRTRAEITAAIQTTTAGIHLRFMVERGEVEIVPGSWPYRYRKPFRLVDMCKREA